MKRKIATAGPRAEARESQIRRSILIPAPKFEQCVLLCIAL